MTLPDSSLRGRIAEILARESETASAARQIKALLKSERFVLLKNAHDALGISKRTLFRRLRAGLLKTVKMDGRQFVDLVAVNGSNHTMTAT